MDKNVATPDPFVAVSGGRSAFRVVDLLALGELIDGLCSRQLREACKVTSAAAVRAFMPLVGDVRSEERGMEGTYHQCCLAVASRGADSVR